MADQLKKSAYQHISKIMIDNNNLREEYIVCCLFKKCDTMKFEDAIADDKWIYA